MTAGPGTDLRRRIHYRGFAVAIVGFVITRVLVAETLYLETTLVYLVAGVLPLVIGLGLTVYGVVLGVGRFSEEYVKAVTRWCFIGTGVMLVVLGLTTLDAALRGRGIEPLIESQVLTANVLLSGAIAGVVIGDQVASNRRYRTAIELQADQALVLNRLLRHEVLNAATIIDGYADVMSSSDEPSMEALATIRDAANRIESTISDIGVLVESSDLPPRSSTQVARPLNQEVDRLRTEYPDVSVAVDGLDDEITVSADEHLRLVFRELLENAAVHDDVTAIQVSMSVDDREVTIRVSDDGPGLPQRQQDVLESRSIPEFDDPTAGFGLQLVRLLVDRYSGQITVREGSLDGTEIAVVIPREPPDAEEIPRFGIPVVDLLRAGTAGIIAGIAMGILLQALTGLLPVIGALYGLESPVVGWITHLFHSVVFALLFAAGCTWPAIGEQVTGPGRSALLGVGWGIGLWLFAAGIVMPVWLRLVGVPAPFPYLPLEGLVGHIVWGAVLGGLFGGFRHYGVGGELFSRTRMRA